jgi:hypothetical protein
MTYLSLIIDSFYSDLNASTGFFFDAILDGIKPPINVNIVETITSKNK